MGVTQVKSIKNNRSITPTDIVAAVIYYALEDKSEKRFTSDNKKLHEFIYEIVEEIEELKEYFIFTNWYPYKYSYEVEDAISNLSISKILTVPDNPNYTQYELERTGEKFIEDRILPIISSNQDLMNKLRAKAKEKANILFEYEA